MSAPRINRRTVLLATSGLVLYGLGAPFNAVASAHTSLPVQWDAVLADIHRRTFNFFWETTNPATGLTPDRWPTRTFCSIAAVGFALTAYCIGVKSGYVSRESAAKRVVATLRTFWHGPQGDGETGFIGYKGFFYHFLGFDTATRYAKCELSNVDTTLFLFGALTAAAYFDGTAPVEIEIRHLAQALFERVDWTFFERGSGLLNMGWYRKGGYNPTNWTGYDEGMMIYLLALASPTHPLSPKSWTAWCATYDQTWGPNFGTPHLGFGPMFGHQFSQIWYDLKNIADAYMRRRHSDYFTNSRLATIAQRNYAIRNPRHFADYGADIWGLSACDGPADAKLALNGREIQFHTYTARGPSQSDPDMIDDGTIAPMAAISSIAFAPEICVPAAKAMLAKYGADLYGQYGFFDSFNPTFRTDYPSQSGHQTKRAGWVSNDYIGIDQGPILAMLENYRSGFIWTLLRKDPYVGAIVKRGLLQAGFEPVAPRGDWLRRGHNDP